MFSPTAGSTSKFGLTKFFRNIGTVLIVSLCIVAMSNTQRTRHVYADSEEPAKMHVSTSSSRSSGTSAIEDELEPFEIFHPVFKKDTDTQSTLHLYNESDTDAAFHVEFTNINGEIQAGLGTLTGGGTIVLDANTTSHFALNDGLYTAIVSSDQKLSSVVRVYDEEKQTLSLYRGTPGAYTASTLYFGPFFKTTEKNSTVHLLNAASFTATVDIQALTADGEVADAISDSLMPNGGGAISADALDLPADFTGWLRVSADQPLAGLLAPTSQMDQIGLYPPVSLQSTQRSVGLRNLPDMLSQPNAEEERVPIYDAINFLPRTYSDINSPSGLRNTHIFLGNPADEPLQSVGNGYEFANPNVEGGHTRSISAQGFQYLSLAEFLELGGAFAGSLVVSSDGPLALGELTESVGGDLIASYGSGLISSSQHVASKLVMPYIAHDSERSSTLAIQNLGVENEDITVNFIDPSGANELTLILDSIEPIRTQIIHTADQPTLADGFVGSVVITSDSYIIATIDEFLKVEAISPTPTDRPTPTPTGTPTPTPPTPTPLTPTPPTPTPTGPFSVSVNVSVPITEVTVGQVLTVTTSLETRSNGCGGGTMDLTLSGMNDLFVPISATRVPPRDPFVLEAQTVGTTALCVRAFGDHSCGNGGWHWHNFRGCSEPITVVEAPDATTTLPDPSDIVANNNIFLPFISENE